jgi:hypothetical protein
VFKDDDCWDRRTGVSTFMTGLSVVATDTQIVNGVECPPKEPEEPFASPPPAGVELRRAAEAPALCAA